MRYMNYVVIGIIFIGIVAVMANALAKARKLSAELARKLVHMSLGLSIFVTSALSNKTSTAVLISISLGAVMVAKESGLFESFRKVGRRSNGDVYYLLGALAALIIADSHAAFSIAILVLTFADALAALVGKAKGKHVFTLFGETKSIEGSLTFAVVTGMIAAAFVLFGSAVTKDEHVLILLLPIVLTPLEAVSPKGLDNMTLPIAATMIVNLLS